MGRLLSGARALLDRGSGARLALLTLALLALWGLWERPLTGEELRLYRRIEAAQALLWEELGRRGLERDEESDPDHSGLIGLEWSETTTTLGDLRAKRCATDPLWAVQALRWFDELGLARGDRIAVLASSSFPGMVLSVLAAAEARGLDVAFAVSLGSSNWGANRPEAPWPVLEGVLRRGGFLRTRPALCTLGAGKENGGGMTEEARLLLAAAAEAEGTPVFRNQSLDEVIQAKMALIRGAADGRPAKLVVNVGGNNANLGDDLNFLKLPSGLILPRQEGVGNGVLGLALREGYPALHLLNLRALADRCGIAWEARRPDFLPRGGMMANVTGLLLFVLVLATHRRWTWAEGDAIPEGKKEGGAGSL